MCQLKAALVVWIGHDVPIVLLLICLLSGSNPARLVAAPPSSWVVWQSRAHLPVPLHGLALVSANDKLFAIGGSTEEGLTDTVYEYDPSMDTWTARASMPTARARMCAVLGVDNKIYAIGGYGAAGPLNTVEVYDPLTNSWSARAPMPTPREPDCASTADGQIYAFGGINYTQGGYYTTAEVYSEVSDTWSSAPSMPVPTVYAGLAALTPNGHIYEIGTPISGNVEVQDFDRDSGSWQLRTPMPDRVWYTGTTVGPNGLIYKLGGYRDDGNPNVGSVSTVSVYDPLCDSWNHDTPLSFDRLDLASATDARGRIYAVGGIHSTPNEFVVSDAVEVGTIRGKGKVGFNSRRCVNAQPYLNQMD